MQRARVHRFGDGRRRRKCGAAGNSTIVGHERTSNNATRCRALGRSSRPRRRCELQKKHSRPIFFSSSALSRVHEQTSMAAAMHTPPTEVVRKECEPFVLSDARLAALMTDLDRDIRTGLSEDGHPRSSVKCYVTYVQDMPNGTERGQYLALDLGGTNFRVLCVWLGEGPRSGRTESQIFRVPAHLQTGRGADLFDHIALCLAEFVRDRRIDNRHALPLGFTFSFPLRQVGLTRGYLSSWTKGFDCSGVVDQDVVRLLKEAIARRGDVKIDVCGILNDTTGTIMSCAWDHPNTRIGLIVGTGCNACYVERVENAEMFDGDASKPHVVINTEWGAFGDDGTLDAVRTAFDRTVDENSLNPTKQVFEKLISGMYIGEIVRLVIVKLAGENHLFGGKTSEELLTAGTFCTSYVSEIESEQKDNEKIIKVLSILGINDASPQDCADVRYICECVSTRSAHLVSAGLAVLLNKMNETSVTIGVDGSVFRFHPHFRRIMLEKTARLTHPDIKFKLSLSNDGSGRGAAFVAAVAVRDAPPSCSNDVASGP